MGLEPHPQTEKHLAQTVGRKNQRGKREQPGECSVVKVLRRKYFIHSEGSSQLC